MGSSRIRWPVASKTALAMAAATPTVPIMPIPLTPWPAGLVSRSSTRRTSIAGTSRVHGNQIARQTPVGRDAGDGILLDPLVKRHADAEDHAADKLAARKLFIEDAARGVGAGQPGKPHTSQRGVDAHLRKAGTKGAAALFVRGWWRGFTFTLPSRRAEQLGQLPNAGQGCRSLTDDPVRRDPAHGLFRHPVEGRARILPGLAENFCAQGACRALHCRDHACTAH